MMEKLSPKAQRTVAYTLLLTVGIIWGASFVVMKNAMENMPLNFILMIRFLISGLILSVFFFIRRGGLDRRFILVAVAMGALQYAAFFVNSYALNYTTAGKSAFINTVYTVLVPFIVWAVRKTPPKPRMVFAAVLCFSGIALLTLGTNEGTVNIGDLIALASGVIYAFYLVLLDKWLDKYDAMHLTAAQFLVVGLIAGAGFLLFEEPPAAITLPMWGSLAYCCLLATLGALTMQNIGMKYGKPEPAALLLSTEAPFAAIAGLIFLNEQMTARMLIGFAVIIAAIVISQIAPKEKITADNKETEKIDE